MSNQIFNKIDGSNATLIGYIETGDLALPDLQRPFVWGNNKVRNLFDITSTNLPHNPLPKNQNGFS